MAGFVIRNQRRKQRNSGTSNSSVAILRAGIYGGCRKEKEKVAVAIV